MTNDDLEAVARAFAELCGFDWDDLPETVSDDPNDSGFWEPCKEDFLRMATVKLT